MQAINVAYRRIKQAGIRGHLSLRRPCMASRPSTGRRTGAVSFAIQERLFNFGIGAVVGFVADFAILSESVAVWVGLPLAVGTLTAVWGTEVLVWLLRKLWWLA